jgi:hypothetical protein
MSFLVGIPRCNPPPALFAETLTAVGASGQRPDAVLIIDNGDTPLSPPPDLDGIPVGIVRPGRNVGCAGAWNLICEWAGNSPVVILNDDCAVAPDTFELMFETLAPTFICARGFCCFRVDPEIYRLVGRFDEGFYPAYWEDTDYRRRLYLAGIPIVEWSSEEVEIISPGRTRTPSGIVHGKHAADGSYQGWTGEKLAWFKSCYEANGRRYAAKWGGQLGKETFDTPFGVTASVQSNP